MLFFMSGQSHWYKQHTDVPPSLAHRQPSETPAHRQQAAGSVWGQEPIRCSLLYVGRRYTEPHEAKQHRRSAVVCRGTYRKQRLRDVIHSAFEPAYSGVRARDAESSRARMSRGPCVSLGEMLFFFLSLPSSSMCSVRLIPGRTRWCVRRLMLGCLPGPFLV